MGMRGGPTMLPVDRASAAGDEIPDSEGETT